VDEAKKKKGSGSSSSGGSDRTVSLLEAGTRAVTASTELTQIGAAPASYRGGQRDNGVKLYGEQTQLSYSQIEDAWGVDDKKKTTLVI
jgi:hypothetical protein